MYVIYRQTSANEEEGRDPEIFGPWQTLGAAKHELFLWEQMLRITHDEDIQDKILRIELGDHEVALWGDDHAEQWAKILPITRIMTD